MTKIVKIIEENRPFIAINRQFFSDFDGMGMIFLCIAHMDFVFFYMQGWPDPINIGGGGRCNEFFLEKKVKFSKFFGDVTLFFLILIQRKKMFDFSRKKEAWTSGITRNSMVMMQCPILYLLSLKH